MLMTRRFVGLLSIAILLCGLALATVIVDAAGDDTPTWVNDLSPIADKDWTYDRAAHLIERAGFGATPDEIARLARMTPQQG